MKSVLVRFFFTFFFVSSSSFGHYDFITAQAYLLVEKDSLEIIDGKNFDKEFPPASTTKVVTSIVALERLSPNEWIVAPKEVLSIPPSKMGLKPKKKYRAIDLIKGMLVKSANDAAYAIACHVSKTEERFTEIMNATARRLGALKTNFKNASGLYDPEQYTTCRDLVLIFRYALDLEPFRRIVSAKFFDFQDGRNLVRFQNRNRFLFCFEPAIGGKTGYTKASRHSYVGAFEKDGKIYILSILASEDLWGDATLILSNLYDSVPGKEEIEKAKAKDVVLASYKPKKHSAMKDRIKLKSEKPKRKQRK